MTTKSSSRKPKPSVHRLTSDLAETSTALARANNQNTGLTRELETTQGRLRDSEWTVRCQAARIERDLTENREFRDAAARRDQRNLDEIGVLRRRVRELEGDNNQLKGQLQGETQKAHNGANAAAVLAYLTMPTGSMPDILANFQQVAVKLGIGPEVKKAATEAITRASAAFASGEWPDDKLAEQVMAGGGGADILGLLSTMMGEGGGPEDLGSALLFGGGSRGRRLDLDELDRP